MSLAAPVRDGAVRGGGGVGSRPRDGRAGTDLQLCAQYCRECTVSVQRMFHVRSLGRVCADALRVGAELFLDLLEDLAQDDDSEVRQSVAEQLGVLTNAIKISRRKQEDDLALGLLNVAFLLVEDDLDGVVAAAEDATATVATLCTTGEERAFLISRVEELCRCEEEEIRISGSKIAGELAEVLGAETTASTLAPLLTELSKDDALQVREATVRATVRAGETLRGTDAVIQLFDIFSSLANDPVWSVRKACADSLVGLSKSVGQDAFAAFAQELFETLANDVSLQVRTGMLENPRPTHRRAGKRAHERISGRPFREHGGEHRRQREWPAALVRIRYARRRTHAGA